MRSIFLALAISLTPIATMVAAPVTSTAQSIDDTAEDVSKLGAWSAEYNAVMVEMAALFDNPVFDKFLEDIMDENVTVEESEVSLKAWRANHKSRMRKLNTMLGDMPAVPKVNSAELQSVRLGLVEQRKDMRTAMDDLDDMAIKLDEIATKVLEGDDSGLEEMSVVLLERGISALINENASLETSKNSLPDKTHPNYYLIGLMQDVNLFSIEELRILKKASLGESGRAVRRDNIRAMGRILGGADTRIKLARASTDKFLKQLRGYSKLLSPNTSEGKMISTVTLMMESFHGAIDVEEKIIELQRRSLAIYESDMSDEEIETKTDALSEELYELIDERIALHGQRANMAASIGG